MENQKPIAGRIPPAPSYQQYQNQKPIINIIHKLNKINSRTKNNLNILKFGKIL